MLYDSATQIGMVEMGKRVGNCNREEKKNLVQDTRSHSKQQDSLEGPYIPIWRLRRLGKLRMQIHCPRKCPILVAMHMAYPLYNYFAMQVNKVLYEDYTGQICLAVTEKQDLQFLTPLTSFANGAGSYSS